MHGPQAQEFTQDMDSLLPQLIVRLSEDSNDANSSASRQSSGKSAGCGLSTNINMTREGILHGVFAPVLRKNSTHPVIQKLFRKCTNWSMSLVPLWRPRSPLNDLEREQAGRIALGNLLQSRHLALTHPRRPCQLHQDLQNSELAPDV